MDSLVDITTYKYGYEYDCVKTGFALLCPSSLPMPNDEKINLKKMEGGFAAAVKFSGKPTEDVVRSKEKELRDSLSKDGLKAKKGCMLARYNDPGRTWNFIMV